MIKLPKLFTQVLVLLSSLLLAPSVHAEEHKLLIDNNGANIYVAHPAEQIVSEQEHFYAFWVSQAAQCKTDTPNTQKSLEDSNQPPAAGDFLCLLRSRQSLGKEWRRYLIDVPSENAGDRYPKGNPVPMPPESSTSKPKIHWQECVLNTSAVDNNVASCAMQLK
jgi:hypothetical protein